MSDAEVTLTDLVPYEVALLAAERLRDAPGVEVSVSGEDLLRAVGAVAALVVPEALRQYAARLPVDAPRGPRHEWLTTRHPFWKLGADSTLHTLVAVRRDAEDVAGAVEAAYTEAQRVEAVHPRAAGR